MRTVLVSEDNELLLMIQEASLLKSDQLTVFNQSNDPLDIMSSVFDNNPSVLIMDDDYTKPHSAHLLKSIRKVNQKMEIIFITSDDSLELGREVSQLGIFYYGHKPLAQKDLQESLRSIKKIKNVH